MLYEQFGELKYKYRNREFWCRGYYEPNVLGKLQYSPEGQQNKIKSYHITAKAAH